MKLWGKTMYWHVVWSYHEVQSCELKESTSSDIVIDQYRWCKKLLWKCSVMMLLIWSLASLYDQLPEADIMMRSGAYPIHSGMSTVFYMPQHRTLSTRHPLALRCMRSTDCWVSAYERQYWKFLGSPTDVWTSTSAQQVDILFVWHSKMVDM